MRDIDRERIGLRLRGLRERAGKRVAEVAEAIGCGAPQIYHAEAGQSGLGVRLLLDLARYYGVPAEEIVHGQRVTERITKRRVA